MNEYSIREMQEYIESIADDEGVKLCYIRAESKKHNKKRRTITIVFGYNPRLKE